MPPYNSALFPSNIISKPFPRTIFDSAIKFKIASQLPLLLAIRPFLVKFWKFFHYFFRKSIYYIHVELDVISNLSCGIIFTEFKKIKSGIVCQFCYSLQARQIKMCMKFIYNNSKYFHSVIILLPVVVLVHRRS